VKLSLKRTPRHHGVGQPSFSSMNWMLYVRDVTVGMLVIPFTSLLRMSKSVSLMRFHRREQGSRIVAQLLTLMDGNRKSSKKLPHVAVVAATNR
jgi:SpoVK/Ycf46/Vps4 family AAA+-type ATPase